MRGLACSCGVIQGAHAPTCPEYRPNSLEHAIGSMGNGATSCASRASRGPSMTDATLSSKKQVSAVEALKVLVDEIDATGVFLDRPADAVKFIAQCVSSALTKLIQQEVPEFSPSADWKRANERTKNHQYGCDCSDCKLLRSESSAETTADWGPFLGMEQELRECRRDLDLLANAGFRVREASDGHRFVEITAVKTSAGPKR